MQTYSLLDHTADLGIRVMGKTLEDLFVHAGLALSDLLVKKGPGRSGHSKIQLAVSGMDWPDLMVNWLRELLHLWTSGKSVPYGVTEFSLKEYAITATVQMVLFDAARDEINHDIKAVTYHQIGVKTVSGGWEGRIIFDV